MAGVDYVEIELSNGGIALVSPEDAELADFRWYGHKVRNWTYPSRGYRSGGKICHEQMGRVVLERMLGNQIPVNFKWVADYINGNTLDNRRSNLRVATYSQRAAHSRRRINARSPYRGVHYQADCTYRPWRAVIRFGGKYILIGNYHTPEEARAAYLAKRREIFGEFAGEV